MHGAVGVLFASLAAFVLPLAARKVRLPGIVLEILFGILVGPAILGWIHDSEVMEFLAELGLLLLMFLSGFEIDFGKLQRQGAGELASGLGVFALTLVLAYTSASALGHGPFVALLLATTSVGLIIPTLRSARRASTRVGQAIIISALMADFLTLIGVTIFAMIRQHGVGMNLLNIPVLFLCIVLLLVLLKRVAWWYPERFERIFDPHDPEEMGIRTCLALMFVFVGLSFMLDVEGILGAFLAGMAFAVVFRDRGELERKMKGFSYGFLIPIFFIHVGMRFDVQALRQPGVLVGALALIAVAVLVKLGAASLLILRRFSARETLASGLLLSARLSLVIAVANLGARLGILDRALESQVILLALVTATLCPTLFLVLQPPRQQLEEPLSRRALRHPLKVAAGSS
jgi:Kef-type K+ transport system membrane component KefB